MKQQNQRTWIGRACIGLVLFFNVQCALVFLIQPEAFVPGFELSGEVGAGLVRGMGLLFLMWNVPYAVALADPLRWRVSLYEAAAMQAVGFVGETLLLITFPPGHAAIRETVGRFILFDGAGLALLLLAIWVTRARVLSLFMSETSAGSPADKT